MQLDPTTNWAPSRQRIRNYLCSPCSSAQTKAYMAAHPERAASYQRSAKSNEQRLQYQRDYHRKKRGSTSTHEGAGYVYGINNPAWPGYVKIGYTDDLDRRLRSYQTGSPLRDYVVSVAAKVHNRMAAERALHTLLAPFRVGRTEWFLLHPDDLRQHLVRLLRQENHQ